MVVSGIKFKELVDMAQALESKGEIQQSWDIYMKVLSANELPDNRGEGYFQLATFLLRNGCRDEALAMFVNAFELKYNQPEILTIINENYYRYDIETLQEVYKKNIEILKTAYPRLSVMAFEELPLKFISMAEKEFYIFDEINYKFLKLFSLESGVDTEVSNDIFMLRNEYNINLIKKYSEFSQEKNIPIYLIYDEFEIFLSYLQIFDFSQIFMNSYARIFFNLIDFICYFGSNKEGLPNRFINANQGDQYVEFVQEVQKKNYQSDLLENVEPILNLSEEAMNGLQSPWLKKTDDIILSFCIPTYNRGHRALENVKNILELTHQREIEVVICDNNSLDLDGGYREISLLTDKRVKYYKNKENLTFCGNFIKVMQLARGNYVYILSDEDFVNISIVPKLLEMMKKEENLAIIRGGIAPKDSSVSQANSFIFAKDIQYKQGLDAFIKYGLKNNYISGTIYNRDYILEGKLFERLIDNLAKHDAYPHLYLEALLCTHGNVQLLSEVICFEGRSESTVQNLSQGVYSYRNRLKQHKAFVHILNEVFESLNDSDIVKKAESYLQICQQTFRLLRHINGPYYIQDGQNIDRILKNAYYHCLKMVNESFDNQKLVAILEKEITGIYNHYN